jgi:formylglycine-generating enzyme required for sulfatase activity
MPRTAKPTVRNTNVGLRCAKDAEPNQAPPAGMLMVSGGRVKLGGQDDPFLGLLRELPLSTREMEQGFFADAPRTSRMHSFRICRYEVSNAEYRRFLEAVRAGGDDAYRHPDQPPGKDHTPEKWSGGPAGDDYPVTGVDWFDAYAFARWAGMRLPTADEWEYAARGSTPRLYPWGDTFEKGKCNGSETDTSGPAKRGSFPEDRSPFDVVDMGGNVAEWTVTDYSGAHGRAKVIKGGAWSRSSRMYGVVHIRSLGAALDHRAASLGFRCVQDAAPGERPK